MALFSGANLRFWHGGVGISSGQCQISGPGASELISTYLSGICSWHLPDHNHSTSMHDIKATDARKLPWTANLTLLPVGVGVGAEEVLVVTLVSDRQSIA